jgi:transposase
LSTIRLAIIDSSEESTGLIDAKNEFADLCVRHRKAVTIDAETPCMAPVFGLRMENGGPARLELLGDFGVEDIFKQGMIVKTWREIIYTDVFGEYVGLLSSCCRRLREAKLKNGFDVRVGMDAADGFWAFAKRYLENYHCLSPETFPLYAKEAEFRFAHRHEDPLPHVAEALCRFVPNRED